MTHAARLIAWLLVGAVTAVAWPSARPVPIGQLEHRGVALDEGRVYTVSEHSSLELDVWSPVQLPPGPGECPPPRPAVLAIHSGSWIGGSRSDYRFFPRDTLIRLARGGVVVVAPDYRLARPGAPSYPAAVDDLRAAVRWIRSRASELNVDPDRIVAFGQSSGAHLAALLAAPDASAAEADAKAGRSSRVQALIGFSGAYDLAALLEERRLSQDPALTLLDRENRPTAALIAEASPINRVSGPYPPSLLVHGTGDAWIVSAQSIRMAEALREAQVLHKLILLPGARHGFEAGVRTPLARDLLPEIFAFLELVWNTPVQPR